MVEYGKYRVLYQCGLWLELRETDDIQPEESERPESAIILSGKEEKIEK